MKKKKIFQKTKKNVPKLLRSKKLVLQGFYTLINNKNVTQYVLCYISIKCI